MLAGSPSDESQDAAQAMGVTLAEEVPDHVGVWPENRWPVVMFDGMLTQWRMGTRGPVGLDYSVRDIVANELRVPRRMRGLAYEGLRVMENAALDYFAERRSEQ